MILYWFLPINTGVIDLLQFKWITASLLKFNEMLKNQHACLDCSEMCLMGVWCRAIISPPPSSKKEYTNLFSLVFVI